MPREKFTALTTNLDTNLGGLLAAPGATATPEQSAVSGALQAGNVTIHIHLSGGMQVGTRAAGRKRSTKAKIETAIRKAFKAFLAANFAGLALDAVVKRVQIVWSTVSDGREQ